MPDKRVLSVDEFLGQIHLQQNHVMRIGLYKRVSRKFHGITENVCNIFLQGCKVLHLINFRDMSQEHNMS